MALVFYYSDIVVQILDARNPLLFRCKDLEKYVKEVDRKKQNLLLLNKSDFLTPVQRKLWARYFDKEKINVAFFSAKFEGENSKDSFEETLPTKYDRKQERRGSNLVCIILC